MAKVIKNSDNYPNPHLNCEGIFKYSQYNGWIDMKFFQHAKNCRNQEQLTESFLKSDIELTKLEKVLFL